MNLCSDWKSYKPFQDHDFPSLSAELNTTSITITNTDNTCIALWLWWVGFFWHVPSLHMNKNVKLLVTLKHKEKLKNRKKLCVCVRTMNNVAAILLWQYGCHRQLWQFQLLSRWVISLAGDKWGSGCIFSCMCIWHVYMQPYNICLC